MTWAVLARSLAFASYRVPANACAVCIFLGRGARQVWAMSRSIALALRWPSSAMAAVVGQ